MNRLTAPSGAHPFITTASKTPDTVSKPTNMNARTVPIFPDGVVLPILELHQQSYTISKLFSEQKQREHSFSRRGGTTLASYEDTGAAKLADLPRAGRPFISTASKTLTTVSKSTNTEILKTAHFILF